MGEALARVTAFAEAGEAACFLDHRWKCALMFVDTVHPSHVAAG